MEKNENIEVDDNQYLTKEECIKICLVLEIENGFEFDLNQIKKAFMKKKVTL